MIFFLNIKIAEKYFQSLEPQHKNVSAYESWVQLSLNHEKVSKIEFLFLTVFLGWRKGF